MGAEQGPRRARQRDALEVRLDDELIRRHELTYTTGAFDKTLLASIDQYDAQGALLGRHRFGYYHDIRDADGGYQAFKSVSWAFPNATLVATWGTGREVTTWRNGQLVSKTP
jgi:hypothetical protein